MRRPKLSGAFSLDPHWAPYWRMINNAAREACCASGLDYEGVRNLSLHRDEFMARMTKVIQDLSFSRRFEEEEIPSDRGYVSGYIEPKSIAEQMGILQDIFPGLGVANEKITRRAHPRRSEGWFVYPRWELIAPTYSQACEIALQELGKTLGSRFYNGLVDELRPDNFGNSRLVLHERTLVKLQKIGDQQKGFGLLAFPAQFGRLHGGCSARRTVEVLREKEFGLGLFHVCIMLITHPNRLMSRDDLWAGCIDQYSPLCNGEFRAPCFHVSGINGGVFRLDSYPVNEFDNFSGFVSGYTL
jgi:hypothetical protein